MNQFSVAYIFYYLILGTGAYDTVRMATEKNSKLKYAIKIYEKSKLLDSQRMNNVKREISILKRVDHPNIIRLYYAIEDRRTVIINYPHISNRLI